MKIKNNRIVLLLIGAVLLACNLPRPVSVPNTVVPLQPPAVQSKEIVPPTLPAENPTAAPPQILPAGEPLLTLEPGSGYLFAEGQVVHGSDDRDLWWNAVQIVPNQYLAALGAVNDLGDVSQISLAAINLRQIEPIPGEAYAMPTTDGKYVLVRMLPPGPNGELNIEWLYPFEGQVLP